MSISTPLGRGGRPDVTARAPAGFLGPKGKETKINWAVVEAKDERNSFHDPARREIIFSEKAKYIGPHTAWFVMVEPDYWVLRPVGGGNLTADADIEISLSGLIQDDFKERAIQLLAENAGVSEQLRKFREGDTSLIATEKLYVEKDILTKKEENRIGVAKKRFFSQIRETTIHLQSAVDGAYSSIEFQIKEFGAAAETFWHEFGKAEDPFDEHALLLHGHPTDPEQTKRHRREAARLKRHFSKSPHIARLAVSGLPSFQRRTGVDDKKLKDLFVIETANLILARILLIRFFEDHGFFDEKRYVCNGGVAAFQNMHHYFKSSYTWLLEHAYQAGSRLYATAFDPTELDWIFGSTDEGLSSAVEIAMFRFARYDFKTIKGDVLTGIYDRFMDRDQRKKLGEFYTPPSIAKYMVKRVGIGRDSRVFDPSCGSGTFLIEAYREMIGDDVERGAADYDDVHRVFGRIAGNDLNTFSSVLTQIQLLWQILGLRDGIATYGFPDSLITGKVNSLVERDQWSALDPFAEIDQPVYDAVVGNPPYLRSERSAQALDKRSAQEFERGAYGFPGVSSKMNTFALFLYRALARWARPAGDDEQRPPGKVAFILPVSLFDGNATQELRRLFQPGGRWTIREVIDLEVIYRKVFDADVLPVILIAENRPPRDDDTVSIRFADLSCVQHQEASQLTEFNLESLPEATVTYQDLFSPDGRILTRVTPERMEVLRRLWQQPTLESAAKRYWVRKKGSRIERWADQCPSPLAGWEERRMIGGGIAFRGAKAQSNPGIDVYKGENIIATELQGNPALQNADLSNIDDIGLWRYQDILPAKGLAIAGVAHCVNGVMFSPKTRTFTNTVTLLFPRDDLLNIPFDLIFLSNIYVWFYALAARMGVLRTLRSHIYPTNLAFLPWSESMKTRSDDIDALRDRVVNTCRQRMDTAQSLRVALSQLGLHKLKKSVAADPDAKVSFSESLEEGTYEAPIDDVAIVPAEDGWRVSLSDDMLDFMTTNRENIANGLALALQQHNGESLTKRDILNLVIPGNAHEVHRWNRVLAEHDEQAVVRAMDSALSQLDTVVGDCLGLNADDLAFIQADLANDPFLKAIRPRYPGTVTRKQGFRTGLDSDTRYS